MTGCADSGGYQPRLVDNVSTAYEHITPRVPQPLIETKLETIRQAVVPGHKVAPMAFKLLNNGQQAVGRFLNQSWPFLWKFLLGPLVGALISILLISRVTDSLTGPNTYTIVFVANTGDPGEQTFDQVLEGLKETTDLRIDGRPVAFESISDHGDLEEAKGIADEIAARNDVLMVVGHGYSTTSKAVLPTYLGQEPPIPVILPTETVPEILPSFCAPKGNTCPVFRLSPNDRDQATTVASFAVNVLKATSFLVVRDSENIVYSAYLTKEFIRQVHDLKESVVLATSDAGALGADTLGALRPDFVFFAGDWPNALILVRQLKRLQEHQCVLYPKHCFAPPAILLSDSSANPRLTRDSGSDTEGVYLCHPRRAKEINKIGYRYYGQDAGMPVTS